MLESLFLKSFQNWPILHIEFDPYLTVLYGATGVGKSCALRALEWVCLNSFRGDWYIRKGCKSTSASLSIDGQTITRYRGPEGNGYKFNGQVYEALYGSVPEHISNLLQIGEHSFSGQFDSPMWLLLSKPEVSRQLNAIVNLDLIDRTLGDLANQVKKARDSVEASENRLKEARQRKQDLLWVLEADEKLTEIEELEAEQQETARKLKDLVDLVVRIEKQQGILEKGETELLTLADLVIIGDKWVVKHQQLQDLELLLAQVEQAQSKVGLATAGLEAAEAELAEYSQGKCPVCGQELAETKKL